MFCRLFVAMVLTLAGCASAPPPLALPAPTFVANAGRSYAPCMSFDLCIYVVRDVISMNWFNPTPTPGSQPLDVVLDIELSPDAKITHVSVARSSGSGVFDASAVTAVLRAEDFRELKGLDADTFDSTFRKFKLHFNPAADR